MASLVLAIDALPKRGLLGLPLEIRRLIYRYVLDSIPKHDIPHQPDCPNRRGHTSSSAEPPAFMVVRFAVEFAEGEEGISRWRDRHKRDSRCICARHRGLSLLCVNRQVNQEAAPIFWQGHKFVFSEVDEFTYFVGGRMSDTSRSMLRRVYIGSPDPWEPAKKTSRDVLKQEYVEQPMRRWAQFWDVLNKCVGLQELAVRPEVMPKHCKELGQLAKRLPELRKLEMTFVVMLNDRKNIYTDFYEYYDAPENDRRKSVFVKCEREVKLRENGQLVRFDPKACRALYRSFTTNFCVWVATGVRRRFLRGADPDGIDLGDLEAAGVSDRARRFRLKLPNGESTEITFLGPPQSKRTRFGFLARERAETMKARREGRMTALEKKGLESIRERQEYKLFKEEIWADIEVRNEARMRDERRRDNWARERVEMLEERARRRRAVEMEKARIMARKRTRAARRGEESEGEDIEEEDIEEERVGGWGIEVQVDAGEKKHAKKSEKKSEKKEGKKERKNKGKKATLGLVDEIEEGIRDWSWDD